MAAKQILSHLLPQLGPVIKNLFEYREGVLYRKFFNHEKPVKINLDGVTNVMLQSRTYITTTARIAYFLQTGTLPDYHIVHIDGNRLNLDLSNLEVIYSRKIHSV